MCRDFYGQPLDYSSQQCQTAAIQSKLSQYSALCALVQGLLGIMFIPRLSKRSDVLGRRAIMLWCLVGRVASIAAMSFFLEYWQTFSYRWIMVPAVLDGVFGAAVLAGVLISLYTSDCVPARDRSKAMGYIQACDLVGKSAGPFLSSTIIARTHSLQSLFVLAAVFELAGVASVVLFARESTTKDHRDKAREAHASDTATGLQTLNPAAAVSTIVQVIKRQDRPAARNTIILLSMDVLFALIIAIRAGIAVLYPELKFGWTLVEIGMLQSATALYRVFVLLVIVPLVIHVAHRIWREDKLTSGVSKTDKLVLIIGNIAETLGYSGYAIAANGAQYAFFYFVATTGVVAKPVVQASLLNVIPQHDAGVFLGSKGALDSIISVAFTSIGMSIYAATVAWKPAALFVISAVSYAFAVGLSAMLRGISY